MQTEVKKIKCDRCGLEIFVEKIGYVNMDGVFTRGSAYEPAERWTTQCYGDELKDLCPACSKQLQQVIYKFWNN